VSGLYPVHIISYNLLTPLAKLVRDLAELADVGEIVIHDHASTYPPLLDWYATCGGSGARVVRHPKNLGPQTLWRSGSLSARYFHVVTDCDLDIAGVPRDALAVLQSGLAEFPDVIKCGLSLEIDDLPKIAEVEEVRRFEGQYWQARRGLFWNAPIDTTLAMYRPERCWGGYKPALRTDRPYTARHTPWYWDLNELTDEQRFYLDQKSIGTWWTGRMKQRQERVKS